MKLNFALFTPVVLSTVIAVAKPASVSPSVHPRVICGSGTALCCKELTPSIDDAVVRRILAILEGLDISVTLPVQLPSLSVGADCDRVGPTDVCSGARDTAACCDDPVNIPVELPLFGSTPLAVNCNVA
ncbi:hypothetical protein PQX77_020128 [Marasmius sp. AFHP31]|nr:hypothetical protein PQX77_020128 [Marasmius sp. AFHP31]